MYEACILCMYAWNLHCMYICCAICCDLVLAHVLYISTERNSLSFISLLSICNLFCNVRANMLSGPPGPTSHAKIYHVLYIHVCTCVICFTLRTGPNSTSQEVDPGQRREIIMQLSASTMASSTLNCWLLEDWTDRPSHYLMSGFLI